MTKQYKDKQKKDFTFQTQFLNWESYKRSESGNTLSEPFTLMILEKFDRFRVQVLQELFQDILHSDPMLSQDKDWFNTN